MYIYKTNHRECIGNITMQYKTDNEYKRFSTLCEELGINHRQFIHDGIRYIMTEERVDFGNTKMLSYGIVGKRLMYVVFIMLLLNDIDECLTMHTEYVDRINQNKFISNLFNRLPNNSTMIVDGDYILVRRPNLEFSIVSFTDELTPICTIGMFSDYFLFGDIENEQYETLSTSTHNGVVISILYRINHHYIHMKKELLEK